MAGKSSTRSRRFWLFKSEADCYSIVDLSREPRKTTCWDGVRNYQARNFLRDDVHTGDGVLFYHSSVEPLAIVGSCTVVRDGYPDDTAWNPDDPHFDARSDPKNPTWYMVDVKLTQIFPEPVTRDQLKKVAGLKKMALLQPGSRLSIQPVTAAEWKLVHQLAQVAAR